MTNWDPRANELFLKARDLGTSGERHDFLDGACGGDAALRAEVEALLKADDRAGSFLEAPAVPGVREAVEDQACAGDTQGTLPSDEDGLELDFLAPPQKPGSLGRLGHYEVLEV